MAHTHNGWAIFAVLLFFTFLALATTKLRPRRAKLLVQWRAFDAAHETYWR